MSVKKIMVMCTGNSFRSHMAEAFIRNFGGANVDVYSSGVKASGKIYPWAIRLMDEVGLDISQHTSDQIDSFLDMQFDVVFTVCDHAFETCPEFPLPVGQKVHHSFKDYEPQAGLSDEDYMQSLRPIRDSIEDYCRELVKQF